MNRLGSEPSSYLRSAAHQPVHWRAWSEEAFAAARAEGKPILLDIGAVWCHWCHVMDRESYEDASTAEVINRLFVAVKVDRDERPDVDVRYQKAIQSMTGQGGWPLTGFLLPDGRVFYGGTYFPPTDAHGRPAFKRVLEAVADAYHTRRDEVETNAAHLAEHIAGGGRRATGEATGAGSGTEFDDETLARAVGAMRADFDAENGGFGTAPKFPHPSAHDFLIERGLHDAAARDVAMFTLERMRAGGIYDQLAGGFHRYSVDAKWIVPHFEKMLYDNAGLLRNYARAGKAETAREIVGFLREVLQHPDGGFGGSQDADVGLDDDGGHFTWTLGELRAAVPDEALAHLLATHYGVRAHGDMHHDPAKCVLRVQADAEALAAAFKVPLDDVRARLATGKKLMQAARAKRGAPFVDPIRYTSWNAMVIQALFEHGGLHGDAEADAMARRALDVFLRDAFDAEKGFARTPGSTTFGMVDDNAQMLDALLEAHYATGELAYLSAARATADVLLKHFAHPHGGFADRAAALAPAAESATLDVPERPAQDAPTASANGVACRALLRLADATGEERYRDAAMAALRALAPDAARTGLFGGAVLLAMHEALHPRPRIVVSARDVDAYRAVARRHGRPGATIARRDDSGVPEEARAFDGEGAIVCLGTRCLAPARSPAELAARLREAG